MSDTIVSLLTPPGTGAIATVEVRGPRAWDLSRQLFRPAGKPLPDVLEINRFWFGILGADEVVLAVTAPDAIEVHCHGGRRVVRWVVEQFLASGAREPVGRTGPPPCTTSGDPSGVQNPEPTEFGALTPPARLLQLAPTLRTASIILDQLNGAFANKVRRIMVLLESDPTPASELLSRLAELGATVGRHLVEPWKVAIAGPPNVGKSSLINALAGYQRSVVSDVAGTTRDAVSVRTAFDGWPVELIDTAGLRDATGLEAEGIERAKRVLRSADLVVWVLDASSHEQIFPDENTIAATTQQPAAGWVMVMNKADRSLGWPPNQPPGAVHLSATTGENVPQLVGWIAYRLAPNPPDVGAAVPYTPQLIESVRTAAEHAKRQEWTAAAAFLRESLAIAEQHHTAGPAGLSSKP